MTLTCPLTISRVLLVCLQEPVAVQVQLRKVDKAGPEAACTASLALTMLLLLKEFLKETYGMSDDRITAFSPDIPDKRKQASYLEVQISLSLNKR